MRGYTRKAILDKVRRSLGNKDKIVGMLREFGIEPTRDVLKAYFIAVARTITFDTVAYLENRPASEEERREIVRELFDEIDKILA